jgi:2-C-methyl-D-erythritol 4-phosphate cytidylyltransferase
VLAELGVPEVPLPEALAGGGVVLLDERCPGVDPDVVRRVVASASESGSVAVGVRPVTDTVKVLEHGYVGPTVDREALVAVCAPVVVPASLVDRVTGPVTDLVGWVTGLEVPVVPVEVPPVARRLADATELALL